jgi:hypothetical protein
MATSAMKNSLFIATICLAIAACGSASKTTPNTADLQAVQGKGSYLLVTVAGTPLIQVDAKDNATCRVLGASAIKKSPEIAANTRCAETSQKSQLPFTAVVRESETQIEIASHFRTEATCKKYAAGLAGSAQVTRNCTRS